MNFKPLWLLGRLAFKKIAPKNKYNRLIIFVGQFALNTRNVISLLKTERTLKLIQLNQEIKDNRVKVDYKESQLDNRDSFPIPILFTVSVNSS